MLLPDSAHMELDSLLSTAVTRGDVPGVVAIIADRDNVIYRGAFGIRNAHRSSTMSPDAIFWLASMTKPVTSVAIMMLREQGLLELDDPIGRYLPDLVGREVLDTFNATDASYTTRPATRAVTIRDLLTHTAGFGYDFANETLRILCSGGARSPRDLPLLHDPGSQWTYGMSTRLLGEAIERITGESLGVFFETHIFRPLGMHDTGFDLMPEDRDRLVSLFHRVNGALIVEQEPESHAPQVFGDYGLLATADDYIRFLQMLLNMGQFDTTRLLTNQSVHALTMNQIGDLKVQQQPGAIPDLSNPFPLGAGEDTFSLGFQLKEGQGVNTRAPGSYSWSGLCNTHFWVDPQHAIAAVVLMQVLPFYDDHCIRLLTDFEHQIYRNLG
jgi:methyl acetate hydrolase